MNKTNHKGKFLLYLALSIFAISGVYQYVSAAEWSDSCAITSVWGDTFVCQNGGNATKNPIIGSPWGTEIVVVVGSPQSPYMQPFYYDLQVSGHTHYWYGNDTLCVDMYGGDTSCGGWNMTNLDGNNGGDLSGLLCFMAAPIGTNTCFNVSATYPDNDAGGGVPISISQQGTIPNFDYNNGQYVQFRMTYENDSSASTAYGDIENVTLDIQFRLVTVDSFNVPATANVGTPFAVNWTTDWSIESGYPRLLLSGPITCNQTTSLPEDGSTQCTLTGAGTATLTLQARGPVTDGAVSSVIDEEVRQVTSGAVPPPTISNIVSISSPTVMPDNTTQYTISITGTDSTGGANITHFYTLINYQGSNAGQYRGYLTWYHNANPWPGEKDNQTCSGDVANDWAAIQSTGGGSTYGHQYLRLDSCSVITSGNTRTVNFVVRFDPSYTTPTTNNDISGYVYNVADLNTGWVNHDLNFALSFLIVPTVSNITISSPVVVANGTTGYNIVQTNTMSNGGGNISRTHALINLQGANTGKSRGLLGWDSTYNWAPEKDARACTGGGYGAVLMSGWYSAHGYQYIELNSCSTTISGNNRTVTYNVSFNPNFLADGPLTDNDISGYVWGVGQESTWPIPWENFETNFDLAVAPTLTTLPATNPTQTSITLNGEGDPNGLSTTAWFRYSTSNNAGLCTDSFGTRLPSSGGVSLGSGSIAVPYSQSVSGLTAGNTYYFCANGSNAGGPDGGSILSFTTTSLTPTVTFGCGSVSPGNPTCSTSAGGSVQLYWTSTNATSCSLDGNNVAVQNSSGVSSGPLSSTRVSTIICSGPGGSGSDSVTINVASAMSVVCSRNPATAFIGQPITWTATVTGGTSPFTYIWDFTGPTSTLTAGPTSSTVNNQVKTYSTLGQKTATVTVRDVNYPSSAQATCSPAATAQINFDPSFEEF